MPRAQSRRISLPEGQRLGDLFGISNDLLACRDYILVYKSLCLAGHSLLNHQLTDCVVTTIFIRYGRCFGTGVRSKTQKALKHVMDFDDLKEHQLAIDFRDKHFAHSINRCESPEITVWLTADTSERAVTSVSVASANILSPDMFVFDNLLLLIDKLRTWAISEQKSESKRLLPLVKERFPLDSLYSMVGSSKRKPMRYGDVSKSRKDT
jgi:hypothetical protein